MNKSTLLIVGFISALLFGMLSVYLLTKNPAPLIHLRDIPILMYHSIDRKGGRFSVTPEEFRSHLEKLYAAGFVTVPLADVLNRKEYLKTTKAVILRFDDSRISQFNYVRKKDGSYSINPECAVGIMLDFAQQYPRFGHHAVFCLIAHVCFGQPRFIEQKLQFLLNNGMELLNHGYYHVRITDALPRDIDNNFGKAMAYFQTVLENATTHIFAVAPPYGAVPQSEVARKRLRCFSYNSQCYPQRAILYAGRAFNFICPSPFSSDFDPYALPCLEVTSSNFDEILASLNK